MSHDIDIIQGKMTHHTGRFYRLIPSQYDKEEPRPSVLRAVASSDAEFDALLELDNLTNGRVLSGYGKTTEPFQHVKMARFHCASDSRFNILTPGHRAWCAAEAIATAQAEVGYHLVLSAITQESQDFEGDYTVYSSYVDNMLLDADSLSEYRLEVARDKNSYFYFANYWRAGAKCRICWYCILYAKVFVPLQEYVLHCFKIGW